MLKVLRATKHAKQWRPYCHSPPEPSTIEFRNCLSLHTLVQLARILQHQITDDTHVVVLSAIGPVFSSGHDLKDFNGTPRGHQQSIIELCSAVNTMIRNLPQPFIACVDGLATAAGCQLAATCDLIFASPNARFSVPGCVSGKFCHTPGVAVAEKMHPRKALELLLLGNELSAEEAVPYGLVNRVFPSETLEEEVEKIAQKMIRFGGQNIKEGKKCFYEQIKHPAIEDKYEAANTFMLEMFQSESCQASIVDFFNKKKP